MSGELLGTRVPERVAALFWDCDPDALRLDGDADFIIDRILLRGDLPEIRWMLDTYGVDTVAARLRATRGRGFSRKALLFWARRLGIPAHEVEVWWAERGGSRFLEGLGR